VNLKSPLRRTAAVAAGALVGLAGVVALAGPASAHHPDIIGGKSCVNEDGSWEVTWEVANSETDLVGKVTDVAKTPADSTLYGIDVESVLPIRGQGVLTGVQKLKASDNEATITITGEWLRDGRTITSARTSDVVKKSDKVCHPTTNPSSTPPAPEPSDSTPPAPEPSNGPSTGPSTQPSNGPSTGPSTGPSESTEPSEEPSTPPAPTKEPEFVYDSTCDTITVGITIPSDWPEEITVVFKTNRGDSKTVVGKIGETTTVEFPAAEGLKITATPKGYEDEAATITYEAPADCDSAGSGGGDDEPSLPLTGAAAGSIAGGAAVLLAVGAGLFFMARRRKVKFTA
jgi:LPXTG-motif cell wall-anchored protein